jgi:hypothetical protein
VTELGDGDRAAVTVNVTGTLTCPLEFPQVPVEHVKTTDPLYVPVASPLTFIETVSVPGVVPVPGETCSQLPPDVVLAATV